jgi:hypothetical protein
MRFYTIYQRVTAQDPDARFVFVKEGFSWPAAIFPAPWLLYHGHFVGLVLFFVLAGVFFGLLELAGVMETVGTAVAILFFFVVGAEANDFHRWALRRRGYQFSGVSCGRSLGEAELSFFRERGALVSEQQKAPQARRATNTGSLAPAVGLFPDPE